ncbi:MAG: hypothetical protein HQM09_06110 [Candidatus Riflebacteria bacterium]|nr:hypothetical protein [Candidatus Riflebacteria bacterium]
MLHWNSRGTRLESFLFLPLLEVIFGIVLMLTSMALPILFVVFNGIHVQQYPEWIFCIGFLLFFLYMGYTLAFQWFEGKLIEGRISIRHNLRGPDFLLERPVSECEGLRNGKIRDEKGVEHTTLSFLARDGVTEIYRGVNPKEVESLQKALETLLKSVS